MDLYPAIDLLDGRCVRLVQGDFRRETTYGDPVETAQEMVAAGARRLHVVDLDAARSGEPRNRNLVLSIVRQAGVPVQSGGGVRNREAAEALLAGGVWRVVVGTSALADPEFVRRLASSHEGAVAIGLDHQHGYEVAVRGWVEGSGNTLLGALSDFEDSGVAAVVVTDIRRDGTLAGPGLQGLSTVLAATEMEVVASGGVGSVSDLVALRGLEVSGRRLGGVIVGKAIHDGLLNLEEALAACAASG
ncbi:MAG: 1-(5-phosphoribosyl)-5-[(5-phosphoribosylamino)methylideneamino] imidazole-4-carboxamide isomerase [Acidimicrobiales bacterium]